MFNIQEDLKKLPDKPGVYIMKDEHENIIYVGKAISLKKRVRQYFGSPKNNSPKVIVMVSNIHSFEYIVTDNEIEALVLECNMIKKHRPKYNILLKDDKTYPYIKITVDEQFPRVFITRRVAKDTAKYFGPYTNVGALNDTLETIKKVFPIRTCKKPLGNGRKFRPCLNFHIKRCLGPCTGQVNPIEYQNFINDIIGLLNGKYDALKGKLTEAMNASSEALDFEKAAIFRDKINSINIITEKQKVLSLDGKDRDVIGYAFNDTAFCIEIFFIRGGKLLGKQSFFMENSVDTQDEVVSSFVRQFYIDAGFVPPEILVTGDLPDKQLIEDMLQKIRGKKVSIVIPQKGEKSQLVSMVVQNAQISLKNQSDKLNEERSRIDEAMILLKELLGLAKIPEKIEAFDISNLGSDDIVAGMVAFKNGLPWKEGYRRYRIKSITISDDYASMREVLTRRIKRLIAGAIEWPDMMLIDGGQNHCRIARSVMRENGCLIPVFGMVKDNQHRTRALVDDVREYEISNNMTLLRFIVSIQDEVHRFAITYSKSLRGERYRKSVLDEVEGIGSKRKQALIKHFGSIEKIKKASVEELMMVKGVDRKSAETIVAFFEGI